MPSPPSSTEGTPANSAMVLAQVDKSDAMLVLTVLPRDRGNHGALRTEKTRVPELEVRVLGP
eukprot:CAMPEP_0167779800 /NCGR_PEP_ID=MMETSP0111_2-20121227/5003_1 /TAXON_ID=91324 /ORGANISM="Lotharella globosa, Strain CCCM811" /LENGTH=61 /DNA_ID=CAMNT_0007670241 /DNA_START=529 /DNA_END=710 /DNA_ORIENTATION=+